MRSTLKWLGLATVLVSPLVAQQPDRGGAMGRPGGMRGHGPSMMMWHRGGTYSPERLLARNGELQLTAQQITALTALRDATHKSMQTAMDQGRKHLDELRVAMDATAPDTVAIRTHFLAAQEAMGQARLARMVSDVRAKALLTDAQRAQVEKWGQHGRRNGWGHGGFGRDGWGHGRGGPGGPGGPGGTGGQAGSPPAPSN